MKPGVRYFCNVFFSWYLVPLRWCVVSTFFSTSKRVTPKQFVFLLEVTAAFLQCPSAHNFVTGSSDGFSPERRGGHPGEQKDRASLFLGVRDLMMIDNS